MKVTPVILFLCPFLAAWAQIPDLDAFTGDLELDLPTPSAPAPEQEPDGSRLLLFQNWEAVHGFPTFALPEDATSTFHLVIPEGTFLVAPNTARISTAYRQLAAEQETGWSFAAPLKVVLHADGNVSVAVRVNDDTGHRLPPGLDLSPLPELRLLGKVVDLQVADRTNPQVLRAFTELRNDARQAGWDVDKREFFFLPLAPGKVWFGLKVEASSE